MKEDKKFTKMSSAKKIEREFIQTELITNTIQDSEEAVMIEIPLDQFEDEDLQHISIFGALQMSIMMGMQALGIEGSLTIRDNDGVLEVIVEK